MTASDVLKKVRIKGEESKKRITLYLDRERYEEFKRVCGNASLSQVVDELILAFIDSAKAEKKK